jgi:hypothetical protein
VSPIATSREKWEDAGMTQPQSLAGSVPAPDTAGCTPEELEQYRGNWIAFSTDGSRIIASSPTLAGLDARVRTAGEDPEQVLLERMPASDTIRSGSELS